MQDQETSHVLLCSKKAYSAIRTQSQKDRQRNKQEFTRNLREVQLFLNTWKRENTYVHAWMYMHIHFTMASIWLVYDAKWDIPSATNEAG